MDGAVGDGVAGGVVYEDDEIGEERTDSVLLVRGNSELMRQFEDGEGSKYNMDLIGIEPLGGGLWMVAFESPIWFDGKREWHIREVAARLRM